jgi:hypothetical protein
VRPIRPFANARGKAMADRFATRERGAAHHRDSGQDAQGGSSATQTALLFGGIALAVAVLAAPMLQAGANYYAQNRAFGIDRVMTGGVAKTERVTVRRSVLDGGSQGICDPAKGKSCPSR